MTALLNMMRLVIALLLLFTLAATAPMPQASVDDDPSSTDPTTPPKSIAAPGPRAPTPAPIGTQPSQCDGSNSSQDCLAALSGGYMWYDKNSQCNPDQKGAIFTALWDATTLASYTSQFPNAGESNHALGAARFYTGPDYAQFHSRIAGNLKRVAQFQLSGSDKEYITISCQDTQNKCGAAAGGKAVGGYGWSAPGWFAWYHYITLCPPFFTVDTLDTKTNEVAQQLANGDTSWAKDIRWLKTTGQYFLHEMMHTRLATAGVEPEIIDELVTDTSNVRAYGAKAVHALASLPITLGGGATRATTNADSYAMLVSAIWWWDTSTYFSGIPAGTTAADNLAEAQDLVFLSIDLNNVTDAATADFNSLYTADLQSFGELSAGTSDSDSSGSGDGDSESGSGDGESAAL
jgi:hypothetical protein